MNITTVLTLALLFLGALLMAIGLNTPAVGCTRIGSVLLAVGFALMLFTGLSSH
jgi:hypothetical protein